MRSPKEGQARTEASRRIIQAGAEDSAEYNKHAPDYREGYEPWQQQGHRSHGLAHGYATLLVQLICGDGVIRRTAATEPTDVKRKELRKKYKATPRDCVD